MSFKFGRASQENMAQCHPDLVMILHRALQISPVDFGVTQGLRTYEQQLAFFLNKDSRLDPRIPAQRAKAKHLPDEEGYAHAVDVYVAVPGRVDLRYDYMRLTVIAWAIQEAALRLHAEGKVGHGVRWGGDWDQDGQILIDQTFNDLPHHELVPL